MNPKISLIAAIGKNRELGMGNDLIFKISEDMKHFREVTKGHPIIMGRKTFDSIGRVLPGRLNIVITRNLKESTDPNLVYISSLDKAIEKAKESLRHSGDEQSKDARIDSGQALRLRSGRARMTIKPEIFIIGGGQIFLEAIKIADKLYLTIVDSEEKDADVFFPDYSDFKKVISERKSSNSNYNFSFIELEK